MKSSNVRLYVVAASVAVVAVLTSYVLLAIFGSPATASEFAKVFVGPAFGAIGTLITVRVAHKSEQIEKNTNGTMTSLTQTALDAQSAQRQAENERDRAYEVLRRYGLDGNPPNTGV